MQADPTRNWTLELVPLKTAQGGRFNPRVLLARHKPTSNEILLVLDEHGYVERAEWHVHCPLALREEAVALFPACLGKVA